MVEPDRVKLAEAEVARTKAEFVGTFHDLVAQLQPRKLAREAWEGAKNKGADLAEDAVLLRHAMSRGHRLLKLENGGSFVYMRHAKNAWRFDPGSFILPSGWRHSEAPHGFTNETVDAYGEAATDLAQVPAR